MQDREAVERTLADLPEDWKAVDVLVNNAGLSRGLTKLYEDDPQNWEEMIDTNVKGLLYVTRAIVPGMAARGSGHVINLGSTAGHQTYANGAVYCATKAAEKSITEGLRIDAIGKGIRVTSIDPGMVETAFSEIRFRGDQEKAAKVYQNLTPLQPEDVADTILWVATRPAHGPDPTNHPDPHRSGQRHHLSTAAASSVYRCSTHPSSVNSSSIAAKAAPQRGSTMRTARPL